jgi:PAS domain S-box-containing protein
MVEDSGSWLSPKARAITELSSDSIFVLDAEYRISYINRTAEGLSIEDAIGTVIFELLTEDQAKVARAAFQEASRTGQETSYEITFPLPDGRLSRWATRIGPQADGSFVVVSSDVTERTSVQDEFDLMFALSQDLLFVSGYDGKFQRVNPAAIEALGYSFEELTTMPFLEFVHPDDLVKTAAAFSQIVEMGSKATLFENRYKTKQGDYRLLQWTARPDPASRRVVGIARDLTEARVLEQRLHQSQKMEAVGQLAGGVAHDFNNLIQAVLGAVDFAHAAEPKPEVVDQLKDIERAAEGAAELVRGLLSFSRQRPSQTETVEVHDLIERTLKLLRRVLPSTIEVRVEGGQSEHRVVADRVQLEQALLNLCLNARDAMPHGGLLTVRVDDIEVDDGSSPELYGVKPGRYVALTVTDEGVGMLPEVRERIFEPFFTT